MCSLYILDISPLSDVGLVKIGSQSVGCCFVPWLHHLFYRCFAVSWGPTFQLLTLEPEPLVFCPENVPCANAFCGYYSLSLLLDSVYLVLCWGPWSTWTWTLCKVINMDLFSFSYLQTASWTSTIYWRCFLFSLTVVFGFFVKDQVFISVWFYFCVFVSIPLINLSVSIPCSS